MEPSARGPQEWPDDDLCRIPFHEYAPRFLKIKNKRGQVVPFELNEPQMRVEAEMSLAKAEGRPVRLIILKARQLGFSTWALGRQYEYATTHEGSECLMAAHDDESSVKLFGRLRLMHDLAPVRPMTRYSNRRELDFANPDRAKAREDPGLLSKVMVGTAGKVNLGRSETLRFLHCSEVAIWPNPDLALLSVEQALARDADTIEIIESTASGVGGEFHERWLRAENPKTRGGWRSIFFAWHSFREYALPLEGGVMSPVPSCVVDQRAFQAEERELKGLYNLTDEQLNWRRYTIANDCGNDFDKFKQEYPSTPEEAFLTSGRPVFNQQKVWFRKRALQALDLRAAADGKKGRAYVGEIVRRNGMAKFEPDPNGPLSIYRLPEHGRDYVIGADVAEGIVKGRDPDACCAQIVDRGTWEQVATWHGRVTPTEFADKLELLGYWYNIALMAPERNNHGHSVIAIMQQRMYPKFHVEQDPDSFGEVPIDNPGWLTNKKTRPMLVDAVRGAVNNNLATLNDVATLDEMLTFIHVKRTGKPEGDTGCHDDRVIALGIAYAVVDWGEKPESKSSVYDPLRTLSPEVAAATRDIQRHVRLAKQAKDEVA